MLTSGSGRVQRFSRRERHPLWANAGIGINAIDDDVTFGDDLARARLVVMGPFHRVLPQLADGL
jgi:hypothetical protein